MDNDYSWTKFNPAAARKLCAYSDRREELLTWLYSALPEETNYLHGPNHKKLTDIDPFTVFGVMNRHISQEKKAEVAKAFKFPEGRRTGADGLPRRFSAQQRKLDVLRL